MKLTATAIKYCVELTVEQFTTIIDKEREYDMNGDYDTNLCLELDALDHVSDVDYNGHFGPNIFYTLEISKDFEIDEINKKVKDIIQKWVGIQVG